MNALLQNIKHVPSTILGICLTIVGALQLTEVQQLCSLSPHVASKVAAVSLWASGIAAILVLGQKTFAAVKGQDQAKKVVCLIVCAGLLSLSTGCAKVVTLPTPNALPGCPDPTAQVTAVAASNIDPALKPTVIANVQQTAKEQCAALLKAHSDDYTAELQRASDAAKNVNSWVATAIQLVLGAGGLAAGIIAATK
jgi:hypothetical protein